MSEHRKRKLHWGFALLGFVTPWLVIAAGVWALSAIADGSYVVPVGLALILLVFGVMGGVFATGRGNGNDRLRSFGLGGLLAYLVTLLLSLLAAGACFVSLGGGGGLFGK